MDPSLEEFTKTIPIEEYSDAHNGDPWIFDEHLDNEGVFVDLIKNPERFSGYNGSDIWHELYEENIHKMNFTNPGPHADFLYRLLSGVQVNVNMHISRYYNDDIDNLESVDLSEFSPNYSIFYERIGKHPERIKNLFYTYTFLLKTLSEIKSNLPHYTYYRDNMPKNGRMQNRMKWLGHYVSSLLGTGEIASNLYQNITQEDFIGRHF